MVNENIPFFSIVTVTYNAGTKLSTTIDSVYTQKCCDYEYIIVDGNSIDTTYSVICENIQRFGEKNIEYRFKSECDNGIYDAMNKGVQMAKGRWICFINAGDLFLSADVLNRVKEYISTNCCNDVVYGDNVFYKNNGLEKYERAKSIESIVYDMPFCHQSVYTKKELLLEHPFSLKYSICSDDEFFLWCYINDKQFHYIPEPLSRDEYGGFSTSEKFEKQLLEERLRIRFEYATLTEEQYAVRRRKLYTYLRYRRFTAWIKRIIPDGLLEFRMYRMDLKKGWRIKQG